MKCSGSGLDCEIGQGTILSNFRSGFHSPKCSDGRSVEYCRVRHTPLVLSCGLFLKELLLEQGIFTRALLADPNWNTRIRELRAIEPSEGIRDVFSSLTIKDDRIALSNGVFQATGVEEEWADIVIVAQV
jgi:hypothetical protein